VLFVRALKAFDAVVNVESSTTIPVEKSDAVETWTR
jgi:hypothetical protein